MPLFGAGDSSDAGLSERSLSVPTEPSDGDDSVLRRALELTVLHQPQVESLLSEAVVTIGSGQSCGVTVQSSYGSLTVSSSDRLAAELDELQYVADDGPSLQAVRTGELVVATPAREPRWAAYTARVQQAGIGSSVSYQVPGLIQRATSHLRGLALDNFAQDAVHSYDHDR